MKRYIPLIILMAFLMVVIGLQYYMKKDPYQKYLDAEYEKLNKQNNTLLKQNDSIKEKLSEYEYRINELSFRDSVLKVKSDTLYRRLNDIRSQYEQARLRSFDWHNDSIRLYFSNF
jgi:chaperonin cofactor prefoldin